LARREKETMNAKLMTVICCAVLLGVAPFGGAHLTAPSATSALLTGDACRYGGDNQTENPSNCGSARNNGVSGTYIGASGAVVSGDIFPLSINPVLTLCPLGYCAAGNALCDLEVLSSGASDDPLKLLDESKVDGGNSVGGNNGGIIPDGTVDDGGLGAACHTDGYGEDDYNTKGCSGVSHAEDAGSEYHVWISPSCDDSSQVSDGGIATCLVNAAIQGLNELNKCVEEITCIVNQTCGAGTFQACGADGTADEVNLGEGGGDRDEVTHNSFPFSNDPDSPGLPDEPGQGVAYPADIVACDPLATGATFVFEGVELNAGIGDDPAGPEYALAIGGWVDWTSGDTCPTSTTTECWAIEAGLTVDLCGTVLGPLPAPLCAGFTSPAKVCYAFPNQPCLISCNSVGTVGVTAFLTNGGTNPLGSITGTISGNCVPAPPPPAVATAANPVASSANVPKGPTGTIICAAGSVLGGQGFAICTDP
jgi:hypothetical protein